MASSRPQDETTEMENRNRRIRRRVETLGAWPEKIPPSLRGLEIRNVPAAGEVFFLDFSFYRTYQDSADLHSALLEGFAAELLELHF